MPAEPHRFAIGCGSAFARDRIDPAIALAESGLVDYLAFDCLAERTLAQAQALRAADPKAGFDPRLPEYARRLAPSLRRGLRVVGSFGAANVPAATERLLSELRAAGLTGTRVGAITGDEALDTVRRLDVEIPDLGKRVSELGDRVLSANAYIGAAPVIECLEQGAQWVLGGRLADVSLFVGPICFAQGWSLDDPDRVAEATMIAHLLECGIQVTGGYFADPPYREVPDQDRLGMPFAVKEGGEWTINKLLSDGGLVDERTVKLQLAYEVHDPSRYMTPDVVADFTGVSCTEAGPDRVAVRGATGRPAPEDLKVLIGVDLGHRVVAEISYAGSGCRARSEQGEAIVRTAIGRLGEAVNDFRIDRVGLDSLRGKGRDGSARGAAGGTTAADPPELRLRVAAHCESAEAAEAVADEVEYLFLGPAGAGGFTRSVTRPIGVFPAMLPRREVKIEAEVIEA